MTPGQVYRLRSNPDRLVLILSYPLPLYGAEEVEIAPVLPEPYRERAEEDVRVTVNSAPRYHAALWNSRLVAVSVLGELFGEVDGDSRQRVLTVRRAQLAGSLETMVGELGDFVGPRLMENDPRAAFQREQAKFWNRLVRLEPTAEHYPIKVTIDAPHSRRVTSFLARLRLGRNLLHRTRTEYSLAPSRAIIVAEAVEAYGQFRPAREEEIQPEPRDAPCHAAIG